MAVQPTETLLVSSSGEQVTAALNRQSYRVQIVSDPGRAMELLRDTGYDLILLDDRLLESETTSLVKEIKRRHPLVPALVLSGSADAAYQTDLMEAGADDFITADLSAEEFQRRIKLILRQRRQARALAQRNQNLQSITQLARQMHSATEPMALIQDTIDVACATFKLYGVAILLIEGDTLRMVAGREGCSSNPELLYENTVMLQEYDPFRRVMNSGIVQLSQNIVADPYYAPIPTLPAPESAIILPLSYQDTKLGALAVFATSRHPLNHDDLLIYEIFASQFAVALHNARHYHTQRISAQSSEHLLRAWGRFINLKTFDEVAENLQQLVEEIPNVPQALVWMYNADPDEGMVVKAPREDIAETFCLLEEEGHIGRLLQQLDERHLQPVLVRPNGPKDPLNPLYKGLRGQQLLLVPILDSARFIGAILASVTNSRQYSSDDARVLAASLAHTAGVALERTMLIQSMAEKSGRLEAILRSTSHGIFFVDDSGHVGFCNPQFTELTGINPSEVLAYSSDVLLNLLAEQAAAPDSVLGQLHEAIKRVLDPTPEIHEDYPIVEISLNDPNREIMVEFMAIGDNETGIQTWAGIIRDNSRTTSSFGYQSQLLDVMSEKIRVPYAQVRGLVTTLDEQHSRFTHRERGRFLHQIEESVERLGHLWENFLEVYNLEVSGLALSREEVDLYEMLQRILDSRAFADARRQVQIDAPASLPVLQLDELRIEQALTNILHNAVRYSPKGAPIHITLEQQGGDVRISVRDQGIGIPAEQVERIFEPFFQASNHTNEDGAGLGLYLAHQVITRHAGSIWIESAPGSGTTVILTLPVVAGAEVKPVTIPRRAEMPTAVVRRPAEVAPQPERGNAGRRVSERPMQTIMIVEGRSNLITRLHERLDGQGYELIIYRTGEEALRDINAVRLDLIFVDVNLSDANGLDICERMCKRTEVPIIMIADEASEPEKVRALMIGADDYIVKPISDEELMARVNVIFKRRRIPDRTREPLDLGSLYIDFARREVFLTNKPLELTRIEYDLLHTLAVNQGQVLTHKQLLEKVWGPEYQAETQYLWVNVSRLRKKLEPTPDSPRYIHTQPGVGYVFRPS
jgi:DNA-binding response OmpR family regulator/signal transduction histidine kinase